MGRLPWLAPFFLRARRLRPVFPMLSSSKLIGVDLTIRLSRADRKATTVSQTEGASANRPADRQAVISRVREPIEAGPALREDVAMGNGASGNGTARDDSGGSAITTGLTTTLSFTVAAEDTAAAVGSGDLPVLGTPRVLAWLESATCAAVADALPQGSTTVGTRVSLQHLAASPVGARIAAQATVLFVDGRLLRFEVAATDVDSGTLLAHGEITRVVVDTGRFLSRVR